MGSKDKEQLKKLMDKIKELEAKGDKTEEYKQLLTLLANTFVAYLKAEDSTDDKDAEALRILLKKLADSGIIITPPPTPTPGPGPGPGPEPEPEPGYEGEDIYGVKKIYPSKQGGAFIGADKFSEEEFTRNYASGKPSENSYECEYKDSNKIENIEVTYYTQINGFKSSPDTMSIKLLGNKHSDGSKDKWLIHQIMTDGSPKENFQIEDPHPKNTDNHQKTLFEIGESIIGKVIGVKAITYIQDGKRHAETWIDFPTRFEDPANNWRKYIDIGDVVKDCKKGFLNCTNGGALLRIDGTKKGSLPTTKFMSIREIDISGGGQEPSPGPGPTPTPPEPTTPSGDLLYDSNTMGNWKNGNARIVTGIDPDCPPVFTNGKGLELHASGNPVMKIDGQGIATLEADPGHGRAYVDAINNGCIAEYDLRFNDTIIENHTCQLRSRHQEGEPPEHRQGGDSFKIDLKTVGLKLEKYHNEHIAGPEKPHGRSIAIGQWVHVKLTDKPDYQKGEIYESIELDGVKVIENTFTNLPPYLMKKSDYDERSYFWLRINNVKKGSVSFRNVKLTAL